MGSGASSRRLDGADVDWLLRYASVRLLTKNSVAQTAVAREKKLVTQMGIQVHSSHQYRRFVKIIQDGAIGKIKGKAELPPDAKFQWVGTEADCAAMIAELEAAAQGQQ